MKKIFVLTAALILLLSACTISDTGQITTDDSTNTTNGITTTKNGTTTTTKNSSTSQQTDSGTVKLNKTITIDGLKFTATEIKRSNGVSQMYPEEGNVYIGIKFMIENTSSEEKILTSSMLFDSYADDIKYLYSLNAAACFHGILNGNLAAGKKVECWHALEIPKGAKKLELRWGVFINSTETDEYFVFDIPQG